MNCRDCEELLQRQLDGESLPTSADLEQHLADCGNCRGLFAAAQRLRQGLRAVARPTAPALFTERATARVLAARRRQRVRRLAVAGFALAASVLIAVWYFSGDARAPAVQPEVVEAKKPVPVPAPKEPSLREAVGEARTALDGLTDKVLANTRDQADVFRDATAPLEIARVDLGHRRTPTDPKPARPRPGMTTGLQTIAATTRRGISFMLQETPPLQPGKKNAAQ